MPSLQIHIETQEIPVQKVENCFQCGVELYVSMYQVFVFVENEVIPTDFIYCEQCKPNDDTGKT